MREETLPYLMESGGGGPMPRAHQGMRGLSLRVLMRLRRRRDEASTAQQRTLNISLPNPGDGDHSTAPHHLVAMPAFRSLNLSYIDTINQDDVFCHRKIPKQRAMSLLKQARLLERQHIIETMM